MRPTNYTQIAKSKPIYWWNLFFQLQPAWEPVNDLHHLKDSLHLPSPSLWNTLPEVSQCPAHPVPQQQWMFLSVFHRCYPCPCRWVMLMFFPRHWMPEPEPKSDRQQYVLSPHSSQLHHLGQSLPSFGRNSEQGLLQGLSRTIRNLWKMETRKSDITQGKVCTWYI